MPRHSPHRRKQERFETYLAAVAKVHGPAPTNPFRWLRLNANLTLQELCDLTGISKQACIRLEQGTYAEPIERVMNFWIDSGSRYNQDTDYVELMDRYEKYQRVIRRRHSLIFGPMPMLHVFRRSLDQHPLTTLRSLWTNPETLEVMGTMSVTECAKLLCIPQSVLDHFNNKIVRQGSVPKPFINALKDNGYHALDIRTFEQAYTEYRAFAVNGITPEEDAPVGEVVSISG